MAETRLALGKNASGEITVVVTCGVCSAVTEEPLMSLNAGDRIVCSGCKDTFLIDDKITDTKAQLLGLQSKVKEIGKSFGQ